MDGEQDFPFIVGPVNRVLGKEIRSLKYLHWWSFLSAYTEIGDCTFQKIVSIRSKRAKGMRLEKGEHIAIFSGSKLGVILAQLASYYQAIPVLVDEDGDGRNITN